MTWVRRPPRHGRAYLGASPPGSPGGGEEAALLVLLTRAARTEVIAANLGCGTEEGCDRRVVVMVVAVGAMRPVHVAIVLLMLVVAVGTMDVAGRHNRSTIVGIGHCEAPVDRRELQFDPAARSFIHPLYQNPGVGPTRTLADTFRRMGRRVIPSAHNL